MFNFHYRLERNSIGFAIGIIVVASIGGAVEIAPLFTIDETVEHDPDMRVYTPLELAGRNIYIREGCYACHSQMIRTLRDEVERYGPYSLAVESQYDHPMLWGSKRTGPDLARIGGKYSDQWHVAHLVNSAPCRAAVDHAGLWLAGAHTGSRRDDLGDHLAAQRRVGVPYTDAMIEHAAGGCRWPRPRPTAMTRDLIERYGEATQIRTFDGDRRTVTEMDALVAYLQILGRLTDAAHAQPSRWKARMIDLDHDTLVAFAKSFGLLYLIGMAAVALPMRCWPSNGARFDKAANDIITDEDKPWR